MLTHFGENDLLQREQESSPCSEVVSNLGFYKERSIIIAKTLLLIHMKIMETGKSHGDLNFDLVKLEKV